MKTYRRNFAASTLNATFVRRSLRKTAATWLPCALAIASLASWMMPSPAVAQGRGATITPSSSTSAAGGMDSPQTKILQAARFDQKMGSQIPLNLEFKDDHGKTVQLQQYFHNNKPVVLEMIFFNCTMLCSEVMNGTLDLMRDKKNFGFEAGRDFELITVSINPRETPELAAGKKATYLQALGNPPGVADGWHLLTGKDPQIKALADAIGYRYAYDAKTDSYSHPGGLILLTPQGKVARYFPGIAFSGQDVRYGLIESSHNKIGRPLERLALFTCFHYDPKDGKYTVSIMRMVQLAGIATVLGIGLGIMLLRRQESKARRKHLESLANPVGQS